MQEPKLTAKTYMLAYLAMLLLLLLNIGIACLNLGWANMFIGVVIGAMEAGVLVMILMQGLYEKALIRLVTGGALLWFLILVTLTLNDYVTRNWVPISGK